MRLDRPCYCLVCAHRTLIPFSADSQTIHDLALDLAHEEALRIDCQRGHWTLDKVIAQNDDVIETERERILNGLDGMEAVRVSARGPWMVRLSDVIRLVKGSK